MADLEGGGSNKRGMDNDTHEEANIHEDEVNLIDYCLVLWKYKYLILLCSVLPTLAAGLFMFLGPRDYKVSYTYNMKLNGKDLRILREQFNGIENVEKISQKFKAIGLYEDSTKATNVIGPQATVSFEVLPSYVENVYASTKINSGMLEELQQVHSDLLLMHVTTKSLENISEITSVLRENFEQVIPLYSEEEHLKDKIISLRTKMAVIEEGRYPLDSVLERKKSSLEKLKNSGSESLGKLPSEIVLQFNIEPPSANNISEFQEFQDIGDNIACLPLPYQLQAAETQIINLEEKIRADRETYDYYAGLLKLNEKFFSHVEKLMSPYYTLGQFRVFLADSLAEYKENEQLQDYLKAYIKRVENKTASFVPLIEKPRVYPVAKGIIKKSATVFMAALMMSVFASFLLEGLKKVRTRAS